MHHALILNGHKLGEAERFRPLTHVASFPSHQAIKLSSCQAVKPITRSRLGLVTSEGTWFFWWTKSNWSEWALLNFNLVCGTRPRDLMIWKTDGCSCSVVRGGECPWFCITDESITDIKKAGHKLRLKPFPRPENALSITDWLYHTSNLLCRFPITHHPSTISHFRHLSSISISYSLQQNHSRSRKNSHQRESNREHLSSP